jgi:hypothetical protein
MLQNSRDNDFSASYYAFHKQPSEKWVSGGIGIYQVYYDYKICSFYACTKSPSVFHLSSIVSLLMSLRVLGFLARMERASENERSDKSTMYSVLRTDDRSREKKLKNAKNPKINVEKKEPVIGTA